MPILTRGGNITQTLAAASPQWSEYHSLLSIVTRMREYHSDTGCCLTSIENTTPSCLSSLRGGNITQTLAAASPQERIPLPPVYPHCGEGISLRHWLLPHLRREYHSLLSILTRGGNITQTLAAASPQERIPLPPAYPHCGEGISLRHWLLPHLRREYYSLLSIVTRGGNITQTLAAASPQWSEYHSLLSIVTRTREYHSDSGCCLTSIENTTPSCLSSLWQGISLRHWLLPHLKREYHSLLSILTRGREYHSDTGCCLTSIENTTPSCLSSLRGGNITQTLAAASPQETIPLPPVYPHSGWEYHSDTGCCLTSGENTTPSCLSSLRGGNITQTLAAASPQETIPLPIAYPHSGWEYHSDTGGCLTSVERIPLPPVYRHSDEGISLRHWLLSHLNRKYHSLLSILTVAGNITQTLAAASPQERIPLPPVYPHSGEGISLRHWLLPHLRGEYDSLLSILTVAGNITQTLAAASPQERIPLPPVYPHSGREYHSDTDCCLTSGNNSTPSCLSSLGGRNITQTLAAASPEETIPLPPVYPHSGREYHSDTGCCLTSGDNTTPSCLSSLGDEISLRHWLLPHLRRQYHSLLPILTQGREYHSDTGCCLTSRQNTTPSCLSSLWQGISLRH